jgi:hypothetical protein
VFSGILLLITASGCIEKYLGKSAKHPTAKNAQMEEQDNALWGNMPVFDDQKKMCTPLYF